MKLWLYRRLIEPLLTLLRQGMTPSSLALCVSIGVVIGNIPILGISTILCAIIALVFRLNLPAMQLVQAAMAPTQILLIIPFVRLGEWITHAPRQPLSIEEGLTLIEHGVWNAVVFLWDAIVHAGTPLRLRMELRNGLLTVAVSDGDPREAVLREHGGGERRRRARYELAGPETLSHNDLVRIVLRSLRRRRALVHVPTPIVSRALRALERVSGPKAFATWDEAELMEVPMLSTRGTADVEALGVSPQRMPAVLGIG